MPQNIKAQVISVIERTGDPLAAIKLNEAYKYTTQVGKMLAAQGASQEATEDYTKHLLEQFPDDMDHIAGDPSFVCALASLFASALQAYVAKGVAQ